MASVSRALLILGCGLFAAGGQVQAQADGPAQVVEAFHAAMQAADRDAVLELMTPEARVYEMGYVDADRTAYAGAHLKADMALAVKVQREVLRSHSGRHGNQAWVLNEYRVNGPYRGKDIDSIGTETMLLEKRAEGWRIHHIHWSQHANPAAD